jgi:hypothetical protein
MSVTMIPTAMPTPPKTAAIFVPVKATIADGNIRFRLYKSIVQLDG